MDDTALRILRAFDRPGLARPSADDLAAVAGADARAVPAVLADMVDSGQLLEVDGRFERTECGRLEVAGPLEFTFLTRAGCHLCEQGLRQIEPLLARLGKRLHVVDVDADRVLREDYGNEVPVLFLGQQEVARHRIDPAMVRAALANART
jgi:hypothetical protein